MPRGTITVQVLGSQPNTSTYDPLTGAPLVYTPADGVNLHQFTNTGRELVVVAVGSGGGNTCSVAFPSVKDTFGRVAPTTPVAVTPGTTRVFGPFSPITFWGDGVSLGYIDPSTVAGSANVAVVRSLT